MSRKRTIKILLSLLCAAALIIGSVPFMAVSAATVTDPVWSVVHTIYGQAYPERITATVGSTTSDGTVVTAQNLNIAEPETVITNSADSGVKYAFDITVYSEGLNANNGIYIGCSAEDLIGDTDTTTPGELRRTIKMMTSGFGFKIDTVNQKIAYYLPRPGKKDTNDWWTVRNHWGSNLGNAVDFTFDVKHTIKVEQDGWMTADGMSEPGRKMVVSIDDTTMFTYALYESGETNCDAYVFHGFQLKFGVAIQPTTSGSTDDNGEYARMLIDFTLRDIALENSYAAKLAECEELYNSLIGSDISVGGNVTVAAKQAFASAINTAKTAAPAQYATAISNLNTAKTAFLSSIKQIDTTSANYSIKNTVWGDAYLDPGNNYYDPTKYNTSFGSTDENGLNLVAQNYLIAIPQIKMLNKRIDTDHSVRYAFDINISSTGLETQRDVLIGCNTKEWNVGDGANTGKVSLRMMTGGFGFIVNTTNEEIAFHLPRVDKLNNQGHWTGRDTWGTALGVTAPFELDKTHQIMLVQDGWLNVEGQSGNGKHIYVYVDGVSIFDYALYENTVDNCDANIFYGNSVYLGLGVSYGGEPSIKGNANITVDTNPDISFCGDTDRNGSIEADDITTLVSALIGNIPTNYTKANEIVSDINTDGYLNILDLVQFKKYFAGIVSSIGKVGAKEITFGNDFSAGLSEMTASDNFGYITGKKYSYTLNLKENATYSFSEPLIFNNKNNLTINGNGAKLVWSDLTNALRFNNCSNCTITDLSVDYSKLPFIQGVVASKSGLNYTVTTDTGYSSDTSILSGGGNIWMTIHDESTGAPKAGTSTDYLVTGVSSAGSTVSLTLIDGNYQNVYPQVGEEVVIYTRGSSAILLIGCEDMTLDSVNLYASPGFGISDQKGPGNTHYDNCQVVPGPKPDGATKNRMMSTNADGMHFQVLTEGPKVNNCTITNTGDDAISAHGYLYFVVNVSGNTIKISPRDNLPLDIGDTICGYNSNSAELGTATITDFASAIDSTYKTLAESYWNDTECGTTNSKLVYTLTLDNAIAGLQNGDMVSVYGKNCDGIEITDSTIGYNRARGIAIRTKEALISGNTITGSSSVAILASADFDWAEGAYPENITIEENIISNCSTAVQVRKGSNRFQMCLGDITVGLDANTSKNGFRTGKPIKNITIENNTITNSGVYGIALTNTNTAEIKNNTITNPFVAGTTGIGSAYGISPTSGATILVAKSSSVTTTGNSGTVQTIN